MPRPRYHDGEGRLPTHGAVLTTAEVAKRMGVCEQRVRQLEATAMGKLRDRYPGLRELLGVEREAEAAE